MCISRIVLALTALLLAVAPGGGGSTPAQLKTADASKLSVELRTKVVLGGTAPMPADLMPYPVGEPSPFLNPKVKAGDVRWHATFAEACSASRRTHKPVLLFQLLGKLDDQFC
jgi:hypothetical protein